jgi:hypothetical protein
MLHAAQMIYDGVAYTHANYQLRQRKPSYSKLNK